MPSRDQTNRGTDCKECGRWFPNPRVLKKHLKKEGHYVPTAPTLQDSWRPGRDGRDGWDRRDTPPRGLQTRHYRHPRSPGHSSRGSSSTSLESSSSENGRSQGYETSQGRGIDDAAGSTGITNQSHNDDGPVASEQRRPSVLETPQMCENNIRASPTATTATHQPSDGGSVTFAIGPGYPLDSNSNLDEASWDDQEARFPEKGNV